MHVPVLLRESLEHLAIRPDGVYLDCTAGLGGHTGQIAKALTSGFVIANDRDAESLALAKQNTQEWADRIRYHHGRFSDLDGVPKKFGVERVDGLLADLGVSRYQLTSPERGFSLQAQGPADMRMDRTQDLTAGEIVNYFDERTIADLIYQFGEERRSRRIARALVQARPIRDTLHMAQVIEGAVPRMGSKLHPATLSFMALRIAVNREMDELDALLELVPRLVAPGGRAVVISFMSLEDRKVKRCFQELAAQKRVRILTKHVVRPDEAELASNAPSRSAKLRAIEFAGSVDVSDDFKTEPRF